MKYNLMTPCDQCPYLLGSGFPFQSLIEHASGEFACHKACDLDEETGEFTEKPNGKTPHCAGALIFLEKQDAPHQMMRITERLGLYDRTKLNMEAPVGHTPREYPLRRIKTKRTRP
jgi:hypothetical protein